LAQQHQRIGDVAHQRVFGDLQFQSLRRHPGGPQRSFDLIGQLFSSQIEGRTVHGDHELFAALTRQLDQVLTGFAQHPVIQFGDQAVGFGDGNESIRRK